jgi:hypothetical protein
MIAKVNTADLALQKMRVEQLCELAKTADPNDDKMRLVQMIKNIVPEYRSQNSVFEELDKISD